MFEVMFEYNSKKIQRGVCFFILNLFFCAQLLNLHHIGSPARSRELNLIILMGPFQLEISYDSMFRILIILQRE